MQFFLFHKVLALYRHRHCRASGPGMYACNLLVVAICTTCTTITSTSLQRVS